MRVSHYKKGNTPKPAIDKLFDEIIVAYTGAKKFQIVECSRTKEDEAVLQEELRKRVSKWKIRLGMIKSCQERKEAKLKAELSEQRDDEQYQQRVEHFFPSKLAGLQTIEKE